MKFHQQKYPFNLYTFHYIIKSTFILWTIMEEHLISQKTARMIYR